MTVIFMAVCSRGFLVEAGRLPRDTSFVCLGGSELGCHHHPAHGFAGLPSRGTGVRSQTPLSCPQPADGLHSGIQNKSLCLF